MWVVVVVPVMREKIANFYLSVADWGKNRSSSFANLMYEKAEQVSANQNTQKMIVLGENDFYVQYVNTNDYDNIAWDDFYSSGAIFFKGFSNPVKIEKTDEPNFSELVQVKPQYRKAKSKADTGMFDLISSQRYQQFMKQHALRDAFTYDKSDGLTMEQWQMITVGAIVFLALVVAGVAL
jgi:hypothetical protein